MLLFRAFTESVGLGLARMGWVGGEKCKTVPGGCQTPNTIVQEQLYDEDPKVIRFH